MAVPILDDIQAAFQVPAMLRLALKTLHDEMPPELETGGIREMLNGLRGKLQELELREIRVAGPQMTEPLVHGARPAPLPR